MRQEPGRRIVSKGEYAAVMGKKAALTSYGCVVLLLGLLCALVTCTGSISLLAGMVALHAGASGMFMLLIGAVMFVGFSFALLTYGIRALDEARQTDAGIPLNRTNTGDLSAPESLVRAAQEPLQAQEAILLRAVAETSEKQEAELLRATTGRPE